MVRLFGIASFFIYLYSILRQRPDTTGGSQTVIRWNFRAIIPKQSTPAAGMKAAMRKTGVYEN